MLTNVVKATRAHYAALQHRQEPGRVALDYEVTGGTSGTVWVKALTPAQRKTQMTRLMNRLRSMYPECKSVYVSFRS